MRLSAIALALLLGLSSFSVLADSHQEPPKEATETSQTAELTPEEQEALYLSEVSKIWSELDKKQGEVKLPNGIVTLQVPDTFYYLNPDDAQRLLVEIWGNPPGSKSQGILFPAGLLPSDEGSWATDINYLEDGYVSDKDAADIDYNALLEQMKESTKAASKEREEAGYGSVELIGWASPPYYDTESHKLHWARELKMDNSEENTLNYNIRVLGRKGVLVLNFIAAMAQKQTIDDNLQIVLDMTDFDPGSTYSDFNPDIDDVAAYGIGALIAGKLAAKAGLLAVALVFLKKFWFLLFVPLMWLYRKIRGKSESKKAFTKEL